MITKTDFEKKVLDFIGRGRLFDDCTGAVLAVSGGSDSMAMLRFFIENRKLFDFPFTVALVNHCIRPEASDEEAGVREFCRNYGVSFHSVSVDVEKMRKTASSEDFSREIRYAFFDIVRHRLAYTHIVTAHNGSDNTETLLLNLIRGSGLNGATGISPKREDNVVRPLLRCSKDETIGYCRVTGTPFYCDKTNDESVYSRNKIRNQVIPVLRQINPSLDDAFLRFITSATNDENELSGQALKIFHDCNRELLLPQISKLSPALLSRIVRLAARDAGFDLTYLQTADLCRLVTEAKTSDRVLIGENTYAVRGYDRIFFINPDKLTRDVIIIPKTGITINETVCLSGFEITLRPVWNDCPCKNVFSCKPGAHLYVRQRQSGDRVRFPKRPEKLLKKLLIDDKIPSDRRDSIPLITSEDEIAWVAGYGATESFSPGKNPVDICVYIKNYD